MVNVFVVHPIGAQHRVKRIATIRFWRTNRSVGRSMLWGCGPFAAPDFMGFQGRLLAAPAAVHPQSGIDINRRAWVFLRNPPTYSAGAYRIPYSLEPKRRFLRLRAGSPRHGQVTAFPHHAKPWTEILWYLIFINFIKDYMTSSRRLDLAIATQLNYTESLHQPIKEQKNSDSANHRPTE